VAHLCGRQLSRPEAQRAARARGACPAEERVISADTSSLSTHYDSDLRFTAGSSQGRVRIKCAPPTSDGVPACRVS
jgi:hypothetical protein